MRRYLFDSGPAFDCMFRRHGVFERMIHERSRGAIIGTGIPVLGEIMGGVENSDNRDQNRDVVIRTLNLFRLWPFDRKAAFEYGRIYAELRRRGRVIQQIDMQLAAIARTLSDWVVVSSDSDLKAVPGLNVEDWTRS